MDISGQVLAVTGRVVNVTKGRNPGPKTIYDIVFSDGNTWTSWDAGTATKAMRLQETQALADLRGDISQSGEFTNYKLTDIAPSGELPNDLPGLTSAPLTPSVASSNGGAPAIPIVASQGGMSPERESKIVKQSCLATAFNFVGHLYSGYTNDKEEHEEATKRAFTLAKTLYAEVYGQQNVAQTPDLVAQAVNAIAGVDAVKVGAETPEW